MSVQPALQRDADLRAEVEHLREANRALSVDLANLQTDVLAKNRDIGRLKTELSKARGEHQTQGDANEVFSHWCGKMSKRQGTKFGEKRQAKVKARLREGFSTDDLKRAIDGCARFPFQLYAEHVATDGPNASRRDDLEYICQDEGQVERFMDLAEREDEKPRAVVPREPRVEPRCALDLADQLEYTHGLKVEQKHGYGATRFMAQCPAHPDKTPSLSITELNDGRILLKCFAGCETQDILRAIGWEWGHLMGGGVTTSERDAQYAARVA